MSIRLRIISEMQRVAAEQQVTLPPLDDNLSLHETGFDSLGYLCAGSGALSIAGGRFHAPSDDRLGKADH